jgi:hypothetical protein
MSETQWLYTLHLSPNYGKTVCSGFQTGVSDLTCNSYISKSGCFNFYWLHSNDYFFGMV